MGAAVSVCVALLLTSVLYICNRSAANTAPPDVEVKGVWSVKTEGSVVTWRLKGVTQLHETPPSWVSSSAGRPRARREGPGSLLRIVRGSRC